MIAFLTTLAQTDLPVAPVPSSVVTESHFEIIINKIFSLGSTFIVLAVVIYFMYQHLIEKDRTLMKQTEKFLEVMAETKNALEGFLKQQDSLNLILVKIIEKIDKSNEKLDKLSIEVDRLQTEK